MSVAEHAPGLVAYHSPCLTRHLPVQFNRSIPSPSEPSKHSRPIRSECLGPNIQSLWKTHLNQTKTFGYLNQKLIFFSPENWGNNHIINRKKSVVDVKTGNTAILSDKERLGLGTQAQSSGWTNLTRQAKTDWTRKRISTSNVCWNCPPCY